MAVTQPQLLIVGAGPTGLVLALRLAKAGTPFRLIDRNSGPGQASRAMAVQARTLEFYRQLGIADEVVAAVNTESLTASGAGGCSCQETRVTFTARPAARG
jgi:2-polyprenyl-6-methoxyphenol hydroxylase-like FAD-dependent oxidoreductase